MKHLVAAGSFCNKKYPVKEKGLTTALMYVTKMQRHSVLTLDSVVTRKAIIT